MYVTLKRQRQRSGSEASNEDISSSAIDILFVVLEIQLASDDNLDSMKVSESFCFLCIIHFDKFFFPILGVVYMAGP